MTFYLSGPLNIGLPATPLPQRLRKYLNIPTVLLREKKVSRNGALKVLNHALIGPEGKDNCHKFIDILGLRTIFPLFMKTPKKTKRTVSAEGIKNNT